MTPVLSREQSRALDRLASHVARVPGLLLMENAGRGAAEHIALGLEPEGRVVVVAGRGNNGGDGFVVARRLMVLGRPVTVYLCGSPTQLRGDAAVNHAAYVGLGGSLVLGPGEQFLRSLAGDLAQLRPGDAVVDALFGTGLDREITGEYAEVVRLISSAQGRRVALDLPSGVDADTGQRLGVAVSADQTITFGHPKPGLFTSPGAELSGSVVVVDIGVPRDLAERVGYDSELVSADDVAGWLTPRAANVHKHAAGHVLVIGGASGMLGALLLAGRGALRAGAGLVTLVSDPSVADVLEQRVLEEMTARLDVGGLEASLDALLKRATTVVVGPGLGSSAVARRAAEHVTLHFDGTKVMDAGALNLFVGRLSELKSAPGRLVLTPHAGELGRLLGVTSAAIEADRFGAVREAADVSGATVLLKGPRTLVATPGRRTWVNGTGSPALATAGSGDVLSGICAAFAHSLAPAEAASAAAWVHGRAGEAWDGGVQDRGLLASEIATRVPAVLAELAGRRRALPS